MKNAIDILRRIRVPTPQRRGCFPILLAMIGVLALPGCGFLRWIYGGATPSPSGPAPAPVTDIPAYVAFSPVVLIEWIAWAFTAIGGLCILAGIVGTIASSWIPFPAIRANPGKIAILGVALLVGAQVVLWIGAYLWWISLIVVCLVLAGLLLYAIRHPRYLEPIMNRDFDGDGKIGE